MARKESIQYTMLKLALTDITNDNTTRAYKTEIKRFANYARSQGYKTVDDIVGADPKKVVQAYRDNVLLPRTRSPSTEHLALAAICKGLDIKRPRNHTDPGWDDRIISTKRTSDKITRGRHDVANPQGQKEMQSDKFQRLVDLQSILGIRRSELGKLRGQDRVYDESGYLCVHVIRGKGGKDQLQRILPDDTDKVEKIFSGIKPEQKVFSPVEMKNHINLHRLRSDQAKRAYQFYAEQVKTKEGRKKLIEELKARFDVSHGDGSGKRAFYTELEKCAAGEPYALRGTNRQKAKRLGLATHYDRTALLAVSVFHLSHWRIGVTVTNYLIQ